MRWSWTSFSSLLRTCQQHEIHHDCGMFAVPKHSEDHADSARVRVARLEILSGRPSHLNDDKRVRRGRDLHPFLGHMRRQLETGTFSHARVFLRSSVSLLSPAGQTQKCQRTSASALTLTANCFLTYAFFNRKPQDTVVETKPTADTTNDVPMETSTEPTSVPAVTAAPATRKRPRLDLASEPRERKRGKTMFGLLVGTLNKAKTEDKERSATDAVRLSFCLLVFCIAHLSTSLNVQARKRQMIEQRLQDKLKKETDSVRRAEEAKKEKQIANRKEEELQLKDSIVCTSVHLESDYADG